ncbi:MAG: WG repeat-containing protein [Chitinophagales bacterium]|nr:WG repeat-containing protein [Chitinophagales bacterium]
MGFINHQGEVIIPFLFDNYYDIVDSENNGLIKVKFNNQNVFINMKGERVNFNAYW